MRAWFLGCALALAPGRRGAVAAGPAAPSRSAPAARGESAAGAVERGRARLEAGRPEEAARLLRAAIARDPRNAAAQAALAQALQQLGQLPAALRAAAAAADLAPRGRGPPAAHWGPPRRSAGLGRGGGRLPRGGAPGAARPRTAPAVGARVRGAGTIRGGGGGVPRRASTAAGGRRYPPPAGGCPGRSRRPGGAGRIRSRHPARPEGSPVPLLSGPSLRRPGRTDDALREYALASELDPADTAALTRAAQLCRKEGRLTAAVEQTAAGAGPPGGRPERPRRARRALPGPGQPSRCNPGVSRSGTARAGGG